MHDLLSKRLTHLIQVAAAPKTPNTIKAELLDLAKLCQVVPQNDFLLEAVANCLTPAVKSLFGAASLILVLTETNRRQVYFAIIAQLQNIGCIAELENDEIKRLATLERLVLARSEDLIAESYGSCPKGFLQVLARLGDSARAPDVYADLFKLVLEVPDFPNQLLAATQGRTLTDEMIQLLAEMPRSPDAVKMALRFESISEYQRFMSIYKALSGESTLRQDHKLRIYNGEKPLDIIERMYLKFPFGTPVIGIPNFRYVKNGADLISVSKRFRNCLGAFVPEALKGEHQYYVWTKTGAPEVVVCIHNDAPFGWYLAEAKLADNERIPSTLRSELKALLENSGIGTSGAIAAMMRPDHQQIMELGDMLDVYAA